MFNIFFVEVWLKNVIKYFTNIVLKKTFTINFFQPCINKLLISSTVKWFFQKIIKLMYMLLFRYSHNLETLLENFFLRIHKQEFQIQLIANLNYRTSCGFLTMDLLLKSSRNFYLAHIGFLSDFARIFFSLTIIHALLQWGMSLCKIHARMSAQLILFFRLVVLYKN